MGVVGRVVAIAFLWHLVCSTDLLCIGHGDSGGKLYGDLSSRPERKCVHWWGTYSLVTAIIICLGYNYFLF